MDLEQLIAFEQTCDAAFKVGISGVVSVTMIAGRKVEFVSFENGRMLALVKSTMGYPAYYRLTSKGHPNNPQKERFDKPKRQLLRIRP